MSHTNGCSNPNCYVTKDCGHVASVPATSTAAELIAAIRRMDFAEVREYPIDALRMMTRLADALEAATGEGVWQWGYVHAQGTNWLGDEQRARADMAASMASDERRQRPYQKRHRLVKRWLGNPVEVENPWAVGGTE